MTRIIRYNRCNLLQNATVKPLLTEKRTVPEHLQKSVIQFYLQYPTLYAIKEYNQLTVLCPISRYFANLYTVCWMHNTQNLPLSPSETLSYNCLIFILSQESQTKQLATLVTDDACPSAPCCGQFSNQSRSQEGSSTRHDPLGHNEQSRFVCRDPSYGGTLSLEDPSAVGKLVGPRRLNTKVACGWG